LKIADLVMQDLENLTIEKLLFKFLIYYR